MSGYLVPLGEAQSEYVEKRSRFIGHIWPVESEEAARAHIEAVKKQRRDARHNCWCYRLSSGAERYSDDGEPQGTAGVPMLGVFQKAGVTDLVCVVTRYFGGVLLGAGGLARAYTQAAKDTLEAAGVGQTQLWTRLALACPYGLFEQVKLLLEKQQGVVENVAYDDMARMALRLPAERAEGFTALVRELTAGSLEAQILGEVMAPAPPSP